MSSTSRLASVRRSEYLTANGFDLMFEVARDRRRNEYIMVSKRPGAGVLYYKSSIGTWRLPSVISVADIMAALDPPRRRR